MRSSTHTLTKKHVIRAANARESIHRGATTGADCPVSMVLNEHYVPLGYTVYTSGSGVVTLKSHDYPIAYAELPRVARRLVQAFDAREEKWFYRDLPLTFDLEFKSRTEFVWPESTGQFVFEPRGNPKS